MLTFDTLYSWVKNLPIVDWHNHLDLRMLAADKPLGSLYEVWVKADPYKHRAMRICGEPERLITTGTTDVPSVEERNDTGTTDVPFVGERNGQDVRCPSNASPLVKESDRWAAWMRTLPKLVGNPLFAWAKMELEWLGVDPGPYLHGRGENISLANWAPSKMLEKFGVEYMSPCVGADGLDVLGQRTSRPLRGATDKMSVVPVWTAPLVKVFPAAQTDISEYFSHTLQAGSYHRRNLPHIGQSHTLVFVTFRLADSLPQSCLDSMEDERRKWLQTHPEPWDEATRQEWNTEIFEKIEKWLDAGHGSCLLADSRLRKIVENALEFFNDTGTTDVSSVGERNGQDVRCPSINGRDVRCPSINGQDVRCPSINGQDVRCPSINGQDVRCPSKSARYRLHGYIVMPNHVHVLMEIFDGEDLSKIVQSWKGFTAKELNRQIGSSGTIWMPEYHDRLVRNAEHYCNVIRYIRKNGEVARKLAEIKGAGATGTTDVSSVENGRPTGTTDVSSVGNGNGQDARCPSIVPSLRMNAGDAISVETLEKFHIAGCRVVDVSVDDVSQLTTCNSQLTTVAAHAATHGWTMLLHLGALRETSARLRAVAGPAGGFAGMRAPVDPAAIAAFLDELEKKASLPRTILLSLNPEAHAQLAVLAGSFNGEGLPGKVQLGPAWWWCDHEEGIRDVLEKNAAYGVLSTFIGMTTDSRSLLSFVRHDYFRRILCKWVAEKVAAGVFPSDEALLRPMLENVCYRNAERMIK